MTDQKQTQPIIRLKNEKIILKLGSAECELSLGPDNLSGDAWNMMNTLRNRITELTEKRNRKIAETYENIEKGISNGSL